MKYFISCAIPNRKLGIIQLEADTFEDMRDRVEKLCPYRAEFKPYSLEEFEDNLPVGEFVPMAKLKLLGYE